LFVAGLHVLPRRFLGGFGSFFQEGRTTILPASQAWFLVITAA
jgi:hypothetical protein